MLSFEKRLKSQLMAISQEQKRLSCTFETIQEDNSSLKKKIVQLDAVVVEQASKQELNAAVKSINQQRAGVLATSMKPEQG